jgi:hypothetical protein
MTNKSWIVTLEEDEHGEVILPFPEDFIKDQGWLEGDILEWDLDADVATIVNISAKEREQNVDKA